MLITKFNKMIRNKLIWGVIAVVVSVFFVLSFSQMQGCPKNSPNAIATMYGEEVSGEELRLAVFFELGLGDRRAVTPEAYELLEERAWQRLAMLRTAERLGITTADEEVAAAVQREPAFLVNGMFDRDRYRAFIRSRNITVQAFEAYVRQTITIQKLIGVLESLVWTSPFELTERLRNLVDERVVNAVFLPLDRAPVKEDIDEEEARAFFERDPAAFEIPERVRVRLVAFPVDDYRPDTVPDADIQDYYNDNIEAFTPLTTNVFEMPTPIEDVREEITDILKRRRARFDAKDAATEFVVDLVPDRSGNRRSWEEVAAERGLNVTTTRYFAIDQPMTNLLVGPEFNAAAFNLAPDDPERYFSDAIVGSNAVYVIAAHDRQEPRIPEFEEVRDEVFPAALDAARRDAFDDYLTAVRERVVEAVATNIAFEAALEPWNLSPTSFGPFSVIGGLNTNDTPYANVIVPRVVTLYEGEVSEPIPVEEGALLLHVAERMAGSQQDMVALRPQLLGTLQDYRKDVLFQAWGDYLLQVAEFEDLREVEPATDGG